MNNEPTPQHTEPGDAPTDGTRHARTTLDRLLASPGEVVREMLGDDGDSRTLRNVLALSILGFALYGAAMGTFQGGLQILRSMVKAPLVVAASLVLCLPSLYVFVGLSAGGTSLRRVTATAATYAALLAAILVGLVPIAWLFSTVSDKLFAVGVIHLLAWILALLLAHRVLGHATSARGVASAFSLLVWGALLFFVSLQMSTHLRPILWQEPDAPFFETERKFFGEHFGDVEGQPVMRAE